GDGARLPRYRHADLVADLFALLDHLGLRQSYLLGSSFGSTVALAALRTRPDRVPRAVLQGGFACRPLSLAERLGVRLVRHLGGPLRGLPGRERLARAVDYATFAPCPPAVWRFFLDCTGSTPVAAFAQRADLLHRVDLRPVLG